MKILIAGFKGDDNSAKILLDYIKKVCNEDILYLENDFEISSKQIEEKLLENYDNVLIFGQKPNTTNIYFENNIFKVVKVRKRFQFCINAKTDIDSTNSYKWAES